MDPFEMHNSFIGAQELDLGEATMSSLWHSQKPQPALPATQGYHRRGVSLDTAQLHRPHPLQRSARPQYSSISINREVPRKIDAMRPATQASIAPSYLTATCNPGESNLSIPSEASTFTKRPFTASADMKGHFDKQTFHNLMDVPTVPLTTSAEEFCSMPQGAFEPMAAFDDSTASFTASASTPATTTMPSDSTQPDITSSQSEPFQLSSQGEPAENATNSNKSGSDETEPKKKHSSSRALFAPRSLSITDLKLDSSINASIEETGITLDDIAAYVKEPDPKDRKADGGKKWTCIYPGCGKKFGRKENIKSHIQTHLGDRQFRCNHCNKCFVRGHDLKRHSKIHTGLKPYPCECGNSFARHDALTRHKQRGMCSGAIRPAAPRTAKRGRPRTRKLDRPDLAERADKAKKTREKVAGNPSNGELPSAPDMSSTVSMSSSAASVTSLADTVTTYSCPPSQAKEDQSLPNANNIGLPPNLFTFTPPTSPGMVIPEQYKVGNVQPLELPHGLPDLAATSTVGFREDQTLLQWDSQASGTLDNITGDILNQQNMTRLPPSPAPLASKPCSPTDEPSELAAPLLCQPSCNGFDNAIIFDDKTGAPNMFEAYTADSKFAQTMAFSNGMVNFASMVPSDLNGEFDFQPRMLLPDEANGDNSSPLFSDRFSSFSNMEVQDAFLGDNALASAIAL